MSVSVRPGPWNHYPQCERRVVDLTEGSHQRSPSQDDVSALSGGPVKARPQSLLCF